MRENGSDGFEDFSMDFPGMNATMNCLVMPSKSNSHGLFGSVMERKHFLSYSMPLLELQMGLILITSHLTRFLLKPFGISDFVSCCLTGIILGPSGLGKFKFMQETIFPHSSQDLLTTVAMFGFSVNMFLAGVQMELGMVFKTGSKALTIGVISGLMPRVCINTYRAISPEGIFSFSGDSTALYAVVVTTSLPAVAYVISQLNLTNTDVGRLGLASGLVGDIFGNVMYTIRVLWNTESVDDAMRNLVPRLGFVLALGLVFRPVMDWVIRTTPEKKRLSTTFIYAVLAVGILAEVYFYLIMDSRYLGAFLVGLAVPSGAPLGSALLEKFETFNLGVLVHIMVPTTLMKANLSLMFSYLGDFKKLLGIVFITFNTKMVFSVASAMYLKIPMKKAVAIAFILNYTNIVQLSIAAVVRDIKVMSDDAYATATLYIMMNATLLPMVIKRLCQRSRNYDDCEGRHIVNMKPHCELKILACIYGQENAEPCIKLLNALHPTRENPMGVYALHLIELTGKYLPVMICHSKHKPTSTSQDVVYSLYQYEQRNWTSASVQIFTSLSPFPLMHHDIVDIAFEKKTSLIIIPLHRRWSVHGHIESDDKRWRRVNCDVLDKAPCSVAIFFSRGRLGGNKIVGSNPSTMSVCMIFLGGNDDREALLIAKLMLRQPEVKLTVFHCLPKNPEDSHEDKKDHMFDTVMLNDVQKIAATNDCLDFRAYAVEDGPEMASIIHSMANQHDLFIVGRRFGVSTPQTSGLVEWCELPELGTIGDLFASKDLDTRASVLVVQHESRLAR